MRLAGDEGTRAGANMEPDGSENGSERRREPRYATEAEAAVEFLDMNVAFSATTVKLSESGTLLRFTGPIPLAVGDDVICEFKVRHGPDQPLPYGGVDRVVRVDGSHAVIELSAGGPNPLESGVADSDSSDPAGSSEARSQEEQV